MPESSAEERSEQPTPRRRQEARQKGQVARSREVNSVAVLLGGLVLLYVTAPVAYEGLTGLMRFAFGDALARPVTLSSAQGLFAMAASHTARTFGPLAVGLVVVALLAAYGQVGLLVTPESVQPKFSHIDPVRGLKRLFSLRSVMRMVFSLLKLGIVAGVFYVAIRNRVEEFFPLVHGPAGGVFAYLCRTAAMVCFQACAVLVVIAVADYGYQRWEHERGLRMTRQEMREEMKRLEGDPLVKSRIRQVQREAARRRMMQELPEADVVVTNPIHYAVALRYDAATMDAPRVVAKGRDRLAQKIRDVARKHGIPFVEDPVLARTLYRTVELGAEVPYALYRAVARVLSYVYQLRRHQPARYVPLAGEEQAPGSSEGAARTR
ncbi:MAG: flagellar biosynthesis protein FlhB [Candidatus Brocadiia bacterium]